jgi:hypothetical protein
MMKKAAQAASELEVPIICGFVGSHVWDKWFIGYINFLSEVIYLNFI